MEGLETKFKSFSDTEYPLKSFGLDVLKHLEECGIECFFCLEDAKQVIHTLITNHALLTLEDVK